MKNIRLTKKSDQKNIDLLLDEAFGPGRFARSVYRYREQIDFVDNFSYVYENKGSLYASISYCPIHINRNITGLLLGPLTVKPKYKGKGYGVALVEFTLNLIEQKNNKFEFVMLVGDYNYYNRFNFKKINNEFKFIGPVNSEKMLIKVFNSKINLDKFGKIIFS